MLSTLSEWLTAMFIKVLYKGKNDLLGAASKVAITNSASLVIVIIFIGCCLAFFTFHLLFKHFEHYNKSLVLLYPIIAMTETGINNSVHNSEFIVENKYVTLSRSRFQYY